MYIEAFFIFEYHEKENKMYYRENKLRHGLFPETFTKKIDIHNNEVCLSLVIKGKKQTKNQFLTCEGEVIPKAELKNWENNKCLIKSNLQ